MDLTDQDDWWRNQFYAMEKEYQKKLQHAGTKISQENTNLRREVSGLKKKLETSGAQ